MADRRSSDAPDDMLLTYATEVMAEIRHRGLEDALAATAEHYRRGEGWDDGWPKWEP